MKLLFTCASFLVIITFYGCSPFVGNQVFYQPIQKANQEHEAKDVVRIYMDKFGYY